MKVRLDQERERANRLELERTEEDEALSGELREIIATVAADSAAASSNEGTKVPAAPGGGLPPSHPPAVGPGTQDGGAVATADEAEPGGGGAGGSGFFSEWRLRRARGRRSSSSSRSPTGDDGDRAGKDAKTGETGEAAGGAAAVPTSDNAGEEKEGRGGEGGGGGGGESESQPVGGRGREKAAGALRTRVVELELQRAEAADEMRERIDRSIRLEVQVGLKIGPRLI